MTEKNEVYVVNQPRHAILSLIILGDELPLSQVLHDNIFKLNDISDVVFVFSDKYNSSHSTINKEKFSTLYRACAWIDSDDNYPETIFKVLSYSEEIFQVHVGYNIINSDNIATKDIEQGTLDNIVKATSSNLVKPIYKLRRLNSEELFTIYNKKDSLDEDGILLSPANTAPHCFFVNKLLLRLFDCDKENVENRNNMFSTYTTDSEIIFLNRKVVKTLLNFYGKDEDNLGIADTFTRKDCRFMFASIIKYLGLDNIDCFIGDLELGEM